MRLPTILFLLPPNQGGQANTRSYEGGKCLLIDLMKSCGRQAERAVTKKGTNQLGESSGSLVRWLAGGVYALFWGAATSLVKLLWQRPVSAH